MSSTNFFFIFIPILSIILLAVNFILAPHKPNKEKKTPFECGYHSFLSQSRKEFSISFFIHALLFLVLDLEIVMTYPYSTSMDANEIYGLTFLILFASLITIGFVYELGIGALKFETKENSYDSFIKKQNIVKKTSNILPSSIYFYLEKYKGPITLFFLITLPLKVISFNLISLFWLAPYIAVICSFMLYIYIQCSDFKPINKNVMIERVLISLAYFFSISLGFAFLCTQTESFYILFSMHIAIM